MAAFPTGYNLARESRFSVSEGVENDIISGSMTQRVVGSTYVSIQCEYNYLTSSERATLRAFLNGDARFDTAVTMTVDGINYSGIIVGGFRERMDGDRYSISFEYRAQEV